MKPTFFDTPADFRAWLAKHHASRTELLVGFRKVGTGLPSVTWPQAVDEALCFGWIDGVRKKIDDAAYSIRFTPRAKTSKWSQVNLRRARALTAAGRMADAGARAFADARAAPPAHYSHEPGRAPALSAAQDRALRANRAAWTHFSGQAPWYRRAATHWITSAKKPETQEKRLAELIACSAAGRPIKALARKDR